MTVAHVVQLCTAHIAAADNLNLLDHRRVNREGTLNTNTERNLANGEGLAHTRALAANNEALENLHTAVLTFNNVHVNVEGVAGGELGNVVTKGLLVDKVESLH